MIRRPIILPAVLALALLGGCGGTSDADPDTSGAKTDAIGDAAVGFDRCMRDHGIEVPDPTFDQDGLPQFGQNAGMVKDAESDKVRKDCAKPLNDALRDAGVSNKDKPSQDQLLAFAQCMREHGVDFPDPQPGRIEIPKAARNSPGWQAAVEACVDKVPASMRAIVLGDGGKGAK